MYVRNVGEDLGDLEDAPPVNNWDDVSYINRPIQINEEGMANALPIKFHTIILFILVGLITILFLFKKNMFAPM